MGEPRFEKIDHGSKYRLPASYNREIGRVIVRWAVFEHQVQSMIWGIAFEGDPLGGALGRLSVLEKRFPERLDLLENLAQLPRVRLDPTLLKDIKTKAKRGRGAQSARSRFLDPSAPAWLAPQTNQRCLGPDQVRP